MSSSFHSSRVVCEKKNDNNNNNNKSWMDPAARQYKYWNRETCTDKGSYSYLIDISPESIKREAKIFSLSTLDDAANEALHNNNPSTGGKPLPLGSRLLAVGTELADFDKHRNAKPNVLFVSPSCPRASTVVPLVLAAFPTIQWIHVRSAGIDFVESEAFATITSQNNIPVTNAKGQFSSSLAEYALLACSYFAKDIPRLMRQQQSKSWLNFDIQELRGKTLGIVGYGDIGHACAKLATQYGMRIVALRRHPYLSRDDPYCNVVYGRDKKSLNRLMSESDYIICSAPSTVETRGMVNADAFNAVKENAVFINLVRAPLDLCCS
jgi:D-isomer specific 2-hydroxyacid dehydrogenase, NAD binding domain